MVIRCVKVPNKRNPASLDTSPKSKLKQKNLNLYKYSDLETWNLKEDGHQIDENPNQKEYCIL